MIHTPEQARRKTLPIKIAVYDNGKLSFVEIEQKAEGMPDTFTKLRNPNFAGVARVRSLERDGFERGPDGDRGQGLAGSTRARASARARQPDAARHAAIHAGRAADRNGALFGSRHLAPPWRERLGDGEGEFPLVEAPSSCGGAMPRCGTPNRFAAQHECGQASLSWAGRDCSNRGSRRLCP
jgi:hypothetical protein